MRVSVYSEDMAKVLKPYYGMKWRPNGTVEADMFFSCVCHNCVHDSRCPIRDIAVANEISSDVYPHQIRIGCNGQPECSSQQPI